MSQPFAAHVLRQWLYAIGWDENNSYSGLTRSSRALLDFTIQSGLQLSLGHVANQAFTNHATLTALEHHGLLAGSIGYFYARPDLSLGSSRERDSLMRSNEPFIVPRLPAPPEEIERVWQGGDRIDENQQLLYGRFYVPTGRLDALYGLRLSDTTQAILSFVSLPAQSLFRGSITPIAPLSTSYDALPPLLPPSTAYQSLNIALQHDLGPWSSEYSYSLEDGMFGARVLHNFGRRSSVGGGYTVEPATLPFVTTTTTDEAAENGHSQGLKGRFSAGAEVFFSAQERSAGVSTGVRFSTLPDTDEGRPSQPPTVITATMNPIMGHLSAAYAVKVGRDVAIGTRFDFNMFSYDSEVAMGGEWWQRSRRRVVSSLEGDASAPATPSTTVDEAIDGDIVGVVKVRASTSTDIRLLWQRKVSKCLVGIGLATDWTNSSPLRAVGLQLQYWS